MRFVLTLLTHSSAYFRILSVTGVWTVKKSDNVGGWAMFVDGGEHDGVIIYARVPDHVDDESCNVTNNRGELLAMKAAIQFCVDNIDVPVEIVADSMYCINTVTDWMHRWYKLDNTFQTKSDGQPIKNSDIIADLYKLCQSLKFTLFFRHIKSHKHPPSDEGSLEYRLWYGNYCADKYAVAGKKLPNFDVVQTHIDEE